MRVTIRKKLIFGFLSVLLLFAIVAGISNVQLKRVDDQYTSLLNERVNQLILVKNFKEDLMIESNGIRGYLLTGQSTNLTDYDMARKRLIQQLEELEKSTKSKEAHLLIAELKDLHTEFEGITEAAIKYKIMENESAYMELIQTSAKEIGGSFSEKADELIKYQENELDKDSQRTKQTTSSIQLFVIILSVVTIVVAMAIAIFISRLITEPIKIASQSIDRIANGELNVDEIKVKNRDEIGSLIQSLNKMVKDLRNVVGQVRTSSTQLASSSEELAASAEQSTLASEQVAQISQTNSAGIEKQLLGFNEVANSVSEMVANIHEITKSSEEMYTVTEQASTLTISGEQTVENVVHQMNEISLSVKHASSSIQQLEARSNEISDIISIITNITEQTNLLALNAAIEAARAGEHGKGFAVVADEVRKLAEQSKRSAEQIHNMIGMIQKETDQAVHAMEVGNKQVIMGLEDTKEARIAFANIAQTIGHVTGKVGNVTTLLEKLSTLSDQINVVIQEVKDISEKSVTAIEESSAATEEQLATMEEVTASSTSLARLAEEMQSVVSRFKL